MLQSIQPGLGHKFIGNLLCSLLLSCSLNAQGLITQDKTEETSVLIELAGWQQGLLVRTPLAEQIDGNLSAKRFLRMVAYRNWVPLSSGKQTLCGLVGHTNVHSSGKEQDHNLRIIPDPNSQFLLDDALYRRKKDREGFANWHDCNGGLNNCMESEVTPAEAFRDSLGYKYFSALMDQPICVYGPWVSERLHNHRPEIHPSEVLWHRTEMGLRIMMFQDASCRYQHPYRFAWNQGYRGSRKEKTPWVLDSLVVEARLPIEMPEPGAVRNLKLQIRSIAPHLQVHDLPNEALWLSINNSEETCTITADAQLDLVKLGKTSISHDKSELLLDLEFVVFRKANEMGYMIVDILIDPEQNR